MLTLPLPLAPASFAVALALAGLACDVAPEPSPFTFDDDASSVAPPPSPDPGSDPVPDPEPDPEPDAPVDDAPQSEPGLLVFVTSLTYTGDLGGIQGADEICAFEAEAAQLSGTFRAWISDSTTDAIDRIDADGPWVLVDGERVFNNRAQLRTSPLRAVNRDPLGSDHYAADVWTGTGAGGRWTGTETCHGWSSEDDFANAAVGLTVAGGDWTESWTLPCPLDARLYCLQVQ